LTLASTVTTYSNLIDVNFPVPGTNNNLKRFRDNFNNITQSIRIAERELSNIRTNGVFLTETNTFVGTITNATITNCNIVLKGYTS
jgi:hypothetical protein